MSDHAKKIGEKLNDLLEKNYDAEKGYKKAAENAKDPKIKDIFNKRVSERYRFGHEIKTELKKLDVEPDKGGSTIGSVHRTWIDVKNAFSSDNDESMLEEAITGEEAALEDYKEALGDTDYPMPAETAKVLTQQKIAIELELNKIKQLEEFK